LRLALQKIYGGEHHPRRANPALGAAVRDKCFLHGVKLVSVRDSLNRPNRGVIGVYYWNEAAVHERTIQFDTTCSTLTLAATLFCACEPGLFSQNIEQACHRIGFERHPLAI
jgi:hypothetical protein